MTPPLGLPTLLVLLFCVCASACSTSTQEISAQAESPCRAPLLRDDFGGVLFLRGGSLSADSKWSRDRLPPFGPEALKRVRDELGFNALRILVFWEAVEPLPGVYDRSYLAGVRALVEAADALGMAVLVDMHQDLFGRGFGQAGAPRWACDESLYANFSEPNPWMLGYLSREVGLCFDRLYQHAELSAAFAAAWAQVVETLKDRPSVLAYELINEPFWGTKNRAEFDRSIAPRWYRMLVDTIRAIDDRPFIAFQPAPTAAVGVPTAMRSLGLNRMIYAPHFYPREVEIGQRYTDDPLRLSHQLYTLCKDAERLRMPLLVGEYGVRRATLGAGYFIDDVVDALDKAQLGAFYWQIGDDGASGYGVWERKGNWSLQANHLARPYPARLAGKPGRWSWEKEAGRFSATWNEDGSALGESWFVLPTLHFPEALQIELQPPSSYTREGSRLRVSAIGGWRRLVVRVGRAEEPERRAKGPQP